MRESALEALARWRFRGITCSIDGVTQETYAAYRRKGDVRRVLETIRRLNDHKRRWKTEYPRLTWQMVWFEHNAHEIDAARALAAELGMSFQLKQNWATPRPAVSTADHVPPAASPRTAPASATAATAAHGEDGTMHYCHQLWDEPQINFDGRLLGCCVNRWGTFGPNAFDVGLTRALADEKLDYAKRMLEGRVPARDDVPCSTCATYLERAGTGTWLHPRTERGVVPYLRRHGMGRAVVWVANRFERPLLPVLRAVGLVAPPAGAHAPLAS